MEIEQILQQLDQAYESLSEFFGNKIIGNPLYLDVTWCLRIGEIKFSYADDVVDKIDDFDYSVEVVGSFDFIEKEKFTAAYVNDGCGNEHWMILSNYNRRKDLET